MKGKNGGKKMTLKNIDFSRCKWVEVLCVLPNEDIYIANIMSRYAITISQLDVIFKHLVSRGLIVRDATTQINKRIVTYKLTEKGKELQSLLVCAKKLI